MTDARDLSRFVDAQRDVYPIALAEIRGGAKRSHWMWFVFPQLRGLGRSDTARYYGLVSAGEARAFLAHPVLGPRYRECVDALQHLPARDPVAVFGAVDALKLCSSLTLFEAVAGDVLFGFTLDRWFHGGRDRITLALLTEHENSATA